MSDAVKINRPKQIYSIDECQTGNTGNKCSHMNL